MTFENTQDGGANGVLLIVRHTKVAARYDGVCYGASDVELAPEGELHAQQVAMSVSSHKPDVVVHSGLQRTRMLAEEIGRLAGVEVTSDARLREMNFGSWELRTWDDIFEDVGHAFGKLITEPDAYAAPGGETAHDVRARVMAWAQELPAGKTVVAVAHGGSIGALRGTIMGATADGWPQLVPGFGEVVRLPLPLVSA